MVSLLSSGNFDPRQCCVEPASLGRWPPPPLALKSRVAMLDSGGMSESEDKPPTLASLRARRGKPRSGKRASLPTPPRDLLSQSGLFSALTEPAESPVARKYP